MVRKKKKEQREKINECQVPPTYMLYLTTIPQNNATSCAIPSILTWKSFISLVDPADAVHSHRHVVLFLRLRLAYCCPHYARNSRENVQHYRRAFFVEDDYETYPYGVVSCSDTEWPIIDGALRFRDAGESLSSVQSQHYKPCSRTVFLVGV